MDTSWPNFRESDVEGRQTSPVLLRLHQTHAPMSCVVISIFGVLVRNYVFIWVFV